MKKRNVKFALIGVSVMMLAACTNNEKNAELNNIPFGNKKNEPKITDLAEIEEESIEAEKSDASKEKSNETTEVEKEEVDEKMPNENNIYDQSSILAIVNRGETLEPSYVPDDLVTIEVPYVNEIPMVNQLRNEASEALTQLFDDASKNGSTLYAVSGYRSYDYQAELYDNYVASHGEEVARTFSAPAGASEHQTGLAIDVTSEDVAYQLVDTFGNTDDGVWLNDNAHRFGFIIRYPYGKDRVTGYMYEPWHLRYVGIELSYALYESGLTYEEYLWEQGIDVKN
ncbi:D-alanyl-D-alanine carboxypeptidase family protein [Phocicoccus pinnipedialis]|uniref:M15 family metallopeptidase n=1 Tax=Phocicoccus pinnipedialis TaxID=110845 RepID=UPI0016401F45|nr:M15 family metallopeptidase [Jeotgalicoccus pinnipedialis]MBP1939643.1 D-alanyl-D-alanine carboxypeptidase [Jeotgalicoccus pinnipedialis]